jgi:hypothetical protein
MSEVSQLCVGDKSDHGGTIITGDNLYSINGRAASCIGDLHNCPLFYPNGQPHGITPIIPLINVPNRLIINNKLRSGCSVTEPYVDVF